MVVVASRGKMKKNFENFRSNEEVNNFAKNCNKLANYTDLDPLRMKLKQEIEIASKRLDCKT